MSKELNLDVVNLQDTEKLDITIEEKQFALNEENNQKTLKNFENFNLTI